MHRQQLQHGRWRHQAPVDAGSHTPMLPAQGHPWGAQERGFSFLPLKRARRETPATFTTCIRQEGARGDTFGSTVERHT